MHLLKNQVNVTVDLISDYNVYRWFVTNEALNIATEKLRQN